MSVTVKPDELVIVRQFSAPPDLVFRAWTDPDMVPKWLSPATFVSTFVDFQVEVGGRLRAGIRSSDGEEYVMVGHYLEIDPPHRLVFTHTWEEEFHPAHDPSTITTITITFRATDYGTEMTFVQSGFVKPDSSQSHSEGWSEALDKMEKLFS